MTDIFNSPVHKYAKDRHNQHIEAMTKIRQDQYRQEIAFTICIIDGWKRSYVEDKDLDKAKAWVCKNIVGENRWLHTSIVFKESKDYEWFILKWK